MKLISWNDVATGVDHYNLEINQVDLVRAKLHDFDRRLLADCDTSDKVSDKLLALETIARRIEEGKVKTP